MINDDNDDGGGDNNDDKDNCGDDEDVPWWYMIMIGSKRRCRWLHFLFAQQIFAVKNQHLANWNF